MRRLVVLRHGNTFDTGETPRRVGCQTDLPLVAWGHKQAELAGQWLHDNNFVPQHIIAGPLKRHQQTAQIAAQQMGFVGDIETHLDISEVDYGPDENQPEEAVIARLGEQALAEWNQHGTVPNGWQVDPEAIRATWRSLMQHAAEGTTLVVTSGGTARFLPDVVDGSAGQTKLSTGGIAIVDEQSSGEWQITSWNIRPEKL